MVEQILMSLLMLAVVMFLELFNPGKSVVVR